MPLLALLLVFIRHALLTTYALSPSHFAGNSHHQQIQCSLMHITSSRGLEEFYCRNILLTSNNTAIASAPHQRCQHLLKGALLLANSTTDLRLFWRFFLSPFLMHFPQLTPCYQVNSPKNLLHEQIQDFIINNQVILICKNFYHRNGVLGTNSPELH